jgi:hypothetical protein
MEELNKLARRLIAEWGLEVVSWNGNKRVKARGRGET